MAFLMPVWLSIKAFLSANGLLTALVVGGGVLLYTYDTSRFNAGYYKGKEVERKNVEKANRKAANLSNSVRSKSKRVRNGPIDPYTIN